MSGTLQLLAHSAALGGLIGIALPSLADRPWPLLAIATVAWMGFWFHLAEAAWIPSWGKGRDWIDRIGILIRGSGFALITVSVLAAPAWMSIVLVLLGLVCMILGRAMWEVVCIRFGIEATEPPIEDSHTVTETLERK